MKNALLKTLTLATILTGATFALTSCGKTDPIETYTGYRNDSEAGFDELLFPVTEDLTIQGTNYVYTETTLLCHTQAHNIVATHMYVFSGTFEVASTDAEEGTKTITLSTPTYGMDKGTGTTLADDPDLMDKFVISPTVVLNTTLYTATFTLA